MCLTPCSKNHQRLMKVKYNNKNPHHFYPDPIRDHLKKHHLGKEAIETTKQNKLNKRLEKEKEATCNAVAIFFADGNIAMNAVQRKTFYDCAEQFYKMGQISGEKTSFDTFFPNERVLERRGLTNRTDDIADQFQKLLL